MILLDTHIWIWYVHKDPRLSPEQLDQLISAQSGGLGVSVFSCWEAAMLIGKGRITIVPKVDVWMEIALSYPGIKLLDLTPEIAVESINLPGEFHGDPADRIIVATARKHGIPLMTVDRKICAYPHVQLA